MKKLIQRMNSGEFAVSAIALVGHADRKNQTGKGNYNQRLSEKRVNAVRSHMIGAGIAADLIQTSARADSQQVQACQEAGLSRAEVIECLLPNRRVEVLVTATRKKR